jgi:hypothetical protein
MLGKDGHGSATNLTKLSKRELNDFFFDFNDLLDNLIHGSPLLFALVKFDRIEPQVTRFSADLRVRANVTVARGELQYPRNNFFHALGGRAGSGKVNK